MIEVGLIVWLIRLNVLQARGSELVLLSERTLRIIRTDPKGAVRSGCCHRPG